MLIDSKEKLVDLRDNNIMAQKEFCHKLYKLGNFLASFLFSSKLISMGDDSEKVTQIASIEKMGYPNIAKELIKTEKEELDYLVKYWDGDRDIIDDFLTIANDSNQKHDVEDDIYKHTDLKDILSKAWYFNYQDNDIHFFTYPGYNIHFLRVGKEILVLDCGTQPREFVDVDIFSFLSSKGYSPKMIVGGLISHAHYDHYSCLQYLPQDISIYFTKETKDLIFIMNKEFLEGKRLSLIEENNTFECGIFKITPIKNGHVLGSVAFDIEVAGKRLLYTGDFSLHDQMLLKGFDVDALRRRGKIDYLVSEHTYGQKDFAIRYEDAAKCLAYAVDFLVGLGLKVFIPAFSIGRAQEVVNIIGRYCKTKPKVLIDGLAKEVTFYYENRVGGVLPLNTALSFSSDIEKNIKEADVIIASSGMLQPSSTAVRYLNLLKDIRFGFVKTGYIEEQQYIHEMVKVLINSNIHYFDISLSAHSNYFELIYTFNVLSPQKIILVHGWGIKN